ncbi:hypothetical protein X777_06734, partial [Ooceraea biroi]
FLDRLRRCIINIIIILWLQIIHCTARSRRNRIIVNFGTGILLLFKFRFPDRLRRYIVHVIIVFLFIIHSWIIHYTVRSRRDRITIDLGIDIPLLFKFRFFNRLRRCVVNIIIIFFIIHWLQIIHCTARSRRNRIIVNFGTGILLLFKFRFPDRLRRYIVYVIIVFLFIIHSWIIHYTVRSRRDREIIVNFGTGILLLFEFRFFDRLRRYIVHVIIVFLFIIHSWIIHYTVRSRRDRVTIDLGIDIPLLFEFRFFNRLRRCIINIIIILFIILWLQIIHCTTRSRRNKIIVNFGTGILLLFKFRFLDRLRRCIINIIIISFFIIHWLQIIRCTVRSRRGRVIVDLGTGISLLFKFLDSLYYLIIYIRGVVLFGRFSGFL